MRIRIAVLTAGWLVMTAGSALALGPNAAYTAGAGLAATPHDFTQGYTSTTTPGLCTTCHTPHKAQAQQLLWNRSFSSHTYTFGTGETTVGGTNLPTNISSTWTGPTPKCLSCHDGTIAIGDVGWFRAQDPTNLGIGDAGTELDADGKIVNTAFIVGDSTTDSMTGNHPVMIPFPLGGAANTYNGATNGTSALVSGWQADPTANGIVLFSNPSGSKVTRVTSAPASGTLGIECASCHDPHNGADVQDRYFLRGMVSGSTDYICTKCHAK